MDMEWKGMDGKKDIASPSASPPSKSTGTRLPEDWVLPKAWGEWALGVWLPPASARQQSQAHHQS
jgi:hypothetical protein